MKPSKKALEEAISQKKTLGKYFFDEATQAFFTDVEIVLVIKKVGKKLYKAQSYFFDGYEIWVEEQKLFFEGDEAEAKEKAVSNWNKEPEMFMSYPIIYTNICCEVSS
ncbi:MAG: hypothetical protein ACFB0B_18460 [Thermonemataceae bacterium]